jgi:hypothetical protein
MTPADPLIDDRYRAALQRFRQLEHTLQQERATIERAMVDLLAARPASGPEMRFDQAAAPHGPSAPPPCPACGKPLVGVGPGQRCYHCGHRLPRTISSDGRTTTDGAEP